jgi:hypothetical protein|tara:strand:- start:815 stop:1828 length:1014 start_codon:yes stop_codon:yes gene_type:complete
MTATRLMYPKTSINNTGMFLTFRAYDYAGAPVPPGALPDIQNVISGSNRNVELTAENLNGKLTGSYGGRGEDGKNIAPTTSGTSGDANNTGVANISLYLPPKIEYQYGAEWSKISFGALGSTLGAGGGIFGAAAKVALATGANSLMKSLTNLDGFQDIPKVDGLSLDTLVGAAFGQTFNDNTLQTFNRMQTRSFNFDYLFLARDVTEENEIRKIVKQFKISMHPEAKLKERSNSLFLGYPHIWRIIPSGLKSKLKVKSNGIVTDVDAKTGGVSDFLPNTKYCALTGLNVDYTPDNVIALTKNGYVQAVRLSLQFAELTALVRQDIENFEDSTTMTEA